MRIAVTGGCGFIGSHVVDLLADAGHEVLALDLAGPAADPRAEVRAVDVLDLPALTEALAGVQVVYHLAGMSNVDHALADPVRTVRLNVDGTGNVLEAARRGRTRPTVLASTVWVYGVVAAPAGGAPLAEDCPVQLGAAGHIYTSTKIAAELLV